MKISNLLPNHSDFSPIIRGIVLVGCAMLLVFAFVMFLNLSPTTVGANPPIRQGTIQQENLKKGTLEWQITQPAANGQIQGYTGEDSINRGGTVHLYVSTAVAEKYSLKIFRLGYYQRLGGRFMQEIDNLSSAAQGYYLLNQPGPVNCPTCITNMRDVSGYETHYTEANWKLSYTYTFPAAWLSGMYVLKLTEQDGGYQWMVPLIVRDDTSHSDVLYDYADFTDQAYNLWGGESLYYNLRSDANVYSHAVYVSMNRPVVDAAGWYDFLQKTYPMARFLEQYGYDVTYTTDVAVSRGQSNLEQHKAYVVGGHDEYYDINERKAVETAKADKINLGFFSGNNIYWQIRLLPDARKTVDRIIVCYKENTITDPIVATQPALDTIFWRDAPVNMPEDKVLALMYTNNYPDTGTMPKPPVHVLQPMRIKNSSNWIFNGTGLHDGDIISDVIGYEIDGTSVSKDIPATDQVTFVQDSPVVNRDGATVHAYSVIIMCAGGNVLFNAADVYWDLRLTDFDTTAMNDLTHTITVSPQLVRITNNILQRMVTGHIST